MAQPILIIDDERPTLKMFQLLLEALGYEAHTAETGEEGLETFRRVRPGIVLTDVKMPGMDGIEVLRRVKEIEPRTEVVVITGHGDIDLAVRALNLDATDFIQKPVQRGDLELALKRASQRLELSRSREPEIDTHDIDGAAVIRLRGNVTADSEGALNTALETVRAQGRKLVLLVFDESASINGAGLMLMTRLLERLRGAGHIPAMVGLSANFREVFGVVGITTLAAVHDSVEEALADHA